MTIADQEELRIADWLASFLDRRQHLPWKARRIAD